MNNIIIWLCSKIAKLNKNHFFKYNFSVCLYCQLFYERRNLVKFCLLNTKQDYSCGDDDDDEDDEDDDVLAHATDPITLTKVSPNEICPILLN